MKPIKFILAVLLIEIGFVFAGLTQPATPTFQPGPVVAKLFQALATNDFETIYKMDFETQLQAEQLRRDTPNFLLEKKLQQDYQNQRKVYEDRQRLGWGITFGIPQQLFDFARLNPEVKVLETRADHNNTNIFQVYVSLKFNSIESAPFLNPLNRIADFDVRLLKECVFQLNFLNGGYYMAAERVGDADVYFAELPFRIIAAYIEPFDAVHIVVLGGTPPFKSKTVLAGIVLEGKTGQIGQKPNWINIPGLYYNNYHQSQIATGVNLPGSISVSDSAGHTDAVSFTLPDTKGDVNYERWFLRAPWSDNDLFRRSGLVRPDGVRIYTLRAATNIDVAQVTNTISPDNNSAPVPAALQETLTKAQAGDAQAQVDLGLAYETGKGVNKDYTEALNWFRKAAEQGNARGQCDLGEMYQRGLGVGKDSAEAIAWFRKSAEQGYAFGQFNLGMSYENGWGVAKDNAEAKRWFQKSSDQGNRFAKDMLQKLNNGR